MKDEKKYYFYLEFCGMFISSYKYKKIFMYNFFFRCCEKSFIVCDSFEGGVGVLSVAKYKAAEKKIV